MEQKVLKNGTYGHESMTRILILVCRFQLNEINLFFSFFPHVLFLIFSHTEDRNFMPHLHKMMTPQKYYCEIFSLNLICNSDHWSVFICLWYFLLLYKNAFTSNGSGQGLCVITRLSTKHIKQKAVFPLRVKSFILIFCPCIGLLSIFCQ